MHRRLHGQGWVRRVVRRGWPVALLSLLLLASGCDKLRQVTGSRPPPKPVAKAKPSPKPSAATVERLRLLAKVRLDHKLEQAPGYDRAAATKALLLEKYKLDLAKLWPAGVPELGLRTEEQVIAELNQALEAEADKQFPAAKRAALVAAAATQFPLYHVGDEVTVQVRAGRTVTGKLIEIGPASLLIGTRTILLDDVIAPPPISFDAVATERNRDLVVKTGYDIPRREFLKTAYAERLPVALRDHYFLRVGGKLVRIDQFIAANVTPLVEAQAKDYNRDVAMKLRAQVVQELQDEGRVPPGMTINPPPWPELPTRPPEYDD